MKTTQAKARAYIKQFESWKNDLKQYWESMDRNQRMYEFYKDEGETENNISLNSAFAVVESIVAQANQTNIVVDVKVKGDNGLSPIEEWMSTIIKDAIDDPDIARFKGTFRKIREKYLRDFLIKGNAIAVVDWFRKEITDGKTKKVLADNPFVRVVNHKNVIFNPAKTLSTSDVYYIETYLKFSDLKTDEYSPKTKKGLYKNLSRIELKAKKEKKTITEDAESISNVNDNQFFYSGNKKIAKKIEPIHVIERWEGCKYTVIAEGDIVIREEYDPLKIGGHNILTSMNYEIEGRPYAYGEIDPIHNPTIAQDKILNQSLDMVERFQRPSILVDPASGMDLDTLITIIEDGGVTYGNPQLIGNVPSNTPPQAAFQTIDSLQAAIERAARFSPYAAGLQSQITDKTQGTKGGIEAIQEAAQPNFQMKIDAIQDSFLRPMARIYAKMIGNLMDPNDVRYGFLSGQNPRWVKATKRFIQGKPTLDDLVKIGMVSKEFADGFLYTLDEAGLPKEIEGARDLPAFDVDWVIDVKLESHGATEKNRRMIELTRWIEQVVQLGVQLNPEKTAYRLAKEYGIEDSQNMFLSQEEKQQIAEARERAVQEQMQREQDARDKEIGAQIIMNTSKNEAAVEKQKLKARTDVAKTRASLVK